VIKDDFRYSVAFDLAQLHEHQFWLNRHLFGFVDVGIRMVSSVIQTAMHIAVVVMVFMCGLLVAFFLTRC
jgi:hypothetical protein